MEPRQYAELILEGWAPPEEVRRLNLYIDDLEGKIECPECGRKLQPKRCEHCAQGLDARPEIVGTGTAAGICPP